MQGNVALAEAAIQAGCRFYAGYPITPQNEIPEYMSKRMPEVGGIFIQAESELAAINMVYGAAACGVRVMTTSSSPGISLMQEGISFLATAELPSVIVNVQRGGPGLGNIAASQGDYFQAVKGGGHGDYRVLVYAPYTVQEIWDLTGLAFDRADRYRTPVMILTDAILGQMSEPLKKRRFRIVQYDKSWSFQDRRPQKGPVVIKTLHTGEGQLEALNNRLQQKYNLMAKKETRFEAKYTEDAELIVVAFGTSARIALSVVKRLRDAGYKIGLFRPITLYPFPSEAIHNTAGMGKRFLTLELNLGQMVEDVRLAVGGRSEVFFYGRPGGGLFSPMEIQEVLLKLLL
jgi:2-oxoglutarate ferredoxin oxidoreductase subunit alpha